jgi:hypothetical protein
VLPALQSAAAGAMPPVVWMRWTDVVFPNRPGVVETAARRSQSIAVGSPFTPASRLPTTWLESLTDCQVGPAKWVAISLPWS